MIESHVLNIVTNKCDGTKYNLRYDWFYGKNNVGFPFQETEWESLEATDWEGAKVEARKKVEEFGLNHHGLQGIVLVSPDLKFLSFTLKSS